MGGLRHYLCWDDLLVHAARPKSNVCHGAKEWDVSVCPPPTVGGLHPPESEYIAAEDYDAFGNFEENQVRSTEEEPAPIGEREWRRDFAHPLAEDYCAIADQEASTRALEDDVETSTLPMEEVVIYTTMARYIQEIQMGKRKKRVDILRLIDCRPLKLLTKLAIFPA